MATYKSKKGKTRPDLKYLRVVLHLTAAIVLSYGIFTDYNIAAPVGMKTNPFGGKFKYLTFICAVRKSLLKISFYLTITRSTAHSALQQLICKLI